MIKKILIGIFIIFALWKFFSVAQIKINFIDNLKNKGMEIVAIKPKAAPECIEQMKYQKFDTAAVCYKRALANDKTNPEIIYFLAYSLYRNKDYKSALFYTDFIIRHFPKSKFYLPAKTLNLKASADLGRKENLQANDSNDYYGDLKNPARWVKTPIRVWIQHTDNNANLRNAFYTWQTALYPTVSFEMVGKKEDANLIVLFGDPPSVCSSNDAIGCTLPYFYASNHSWIGKAEIYITRFTRYGTRLSDNDIYGVLVHEIGHAIGIMGHSRNQSDVMYPSSDNYNLRPTRRDVSTVRKIYSSIKGR